MKIKVLFLLIILVFLTLRLSGLDSDITDSDSARWHNRSQIFLRALLSKNYSKTYLHNQPGITVTWVGASTEHAIKTLYPEKIPDLSSSSWYFYIHQYSRALLVLILSTLFVFQMRVLVKLYSVKVSLVYGFFMALEPYLIGIDRFFHVTSLETYSVFLAFLLILLWEKEDKRKYLVLSALFFGISLLTKVSSILVLPLIMLVVALKLKLRALPSLLTFFTILIAVAFMLLPALWMRPMEVVTDVFKGVDNAISTDARSMYNSGAFSLLYYAFVFVLRSSPVVLAGFLLGASKNINIPELKKNKYLLLYLLIYYVSFSFSVKKIDRYVISLLPPAILLASIFISSIKTSYLKVVLAAHLLFVLFIVYAYYPVFSAYYDPLLGGVKTANMLDIYTNSGQYYTQAALYLKDKPGNVFVPFNKESFYYVFENKSNLQDVYDKNVQYVVVSANKLSGGNVLRSRCKSLDKSFGSKLDPIVFVYRCAD